ncbi:6180_t:CDS:2 [Acaulospora colombiana]|uniref:6180_t:CDS:1 n=1 Tax=Acaulospora colombiana TaxID=27376 RepID=A0ACA9LXF5_9GLOM|nr:6180_t:CDS:2 [Acaulospora colombiana]
MQNDNPLESILNLQLSSDALAVLYLPSLLQTLSPNYFLASADSAFRQDKFTSDGSTSVLSIAQLGKWTNRITSLLQSKDPSARWTGICLAKKTCELRRDIMIEFSQRWINLTLPLLSKSEPVAVWNAAIDLLVYVFTKNIHLPEFRRQVSTPTVPKFSAALLELVQKGDTSLKVSQLSGYKIPHIASNPQCSNPIIHYVATCGLISCHSTDIDYVRSGSSAGLYASYRWKGWSAHCLERHYGECALRSMEMPSRTAEINPSRAVLVPLADLATFTIQLLRTTELPQLPQSDLTRYQLEKQVNPRLVELGATMSTILATSQATSLNGTNAQEGGKKSKGKNRAKNLQGEEVLSLVEEGISSRLSTREELDVVLYALDVFQRILRMPFLSASLYSIGTRLVLALHLQLTGQPPPTEVDFGSHKASVDTVFHSQLQAKLIDIQSELCLGTSGYAWRGMGVSVDILLKADEETMVSSATKSSIRLIDALLHPRLPPSSRPLLKPESLMLFREDESKEERDERVGLRLEDDMEINYEVDTEARRRISTGQDIAMQDERVQTGQETLDISGGTIIRIEESPTVPNLVVSKELSQTSMVQQVDHQAVETSQHSQQQNLMDMSELSEPTNDFIRTSFTSKPPISVAQSGDKTIMANQSTSVMVSKNDTDEPAQEAPSWKLSKTMDSDSDEDIPSINMSSDSE